MDDFLSRVFGTRHLAQMLSKIFAESEPAIRDADLIGLTGRVISGRITTTFGTARVKAPNGSELTVSCRVRENDDIPLKGDTVMLVDYDSTVRIFDVTRVNNLITS